MIDDTEPPTAFRMHLPEASDRVSIRVDGRPVDACRGEMLAAALMAAGIWRLRDSPGQHQPRGAFCLMGVCQECRVRVDGAVQQACLVTVEAGLEVALGGGP